MKVELHEQANKGPHRGHFHITMEAETMKEAAFLIRMARSSTKEVSELSTMGNKDGTVSAYVRTKARRVSRNWLSAGDKS